MALPIFRIASLVTQTIDPSDFTQMVVKRIFCELVDYATTHETITIQEFAKVLPAELVPTLDKLYLSDVSAFAAIDQLKKELVHAVHMAKVRLLRRKIRQLTTQIATAERSQNEDSLNDLQKQLKEATDALKIIS